MKSKDLDRLEMTVLSGIISYKAEQDKAQKLNRDYFFNPKHKEILRCIHLLQSESVPVDIFTIKQKMNPGLVDIAYLAEITSTHIILSHLDRAIFDLQQAWMAREITAKCERAIIKLNQHDTQPIDIVSYLETELKAITANQSERFDQIPETANETLKQIEHVAQERAKAIKEGKKFVSGVNTGLNAFDQHTGGLQRTDLIIIAARPAMGKTALMMTMARNASFTRPIGVFSLEMSSEQLTKRLIASGSGVSIMRMNTGEIDARNFKHLQMAVDDLQKCNIIVNDQAGLSLNQLRYKAKMMHKDYNVEAIFIDYLQLITNPVKGLNREQQISGISAGLKQLAKELNIPIVALAQLSRAVETRGGTKEPILSDLRESGSIEQDADIIGFLYRPEYYGITIDEAGNSTEGVAMIHIEKFRNGSVGKLAFHFDAVRTEWRDFDSIRFDKEVDYTDRPF